jgi:hypothetical protein
MNFNDIFWGCKLVIDRERSDKEVLEKAGAEVKFVENLDPDICGDNNHYLAEVRINDFPTFLDNILEHVHLLQHFPLTHYEKN